VDPDLDPGFEIFEDLESGFAIFADQDPGHQKKICVFFVKKVKQELEIRIKMRIRIQELKKCGSGCRFFNNADPMRIWIRNPDLHKKFSSLKVENGSKNYCFRIHIFLTREVPDSQPLFSFIWRGRPKKCFKDSGHFSLRGTLL